MSDKDIIKALECIADEDAILCAECAFANVEIAFCCRKIVAKAAIDYIKRQQAEIERMTDLVFDLTDDNEAWVADNHDFRVELKTAKAGAIREFAKRLHKIARAFCEYDEAGLNCATFAVEIEVIDNLVKEMTEETP